MNDLHKQNAKAAAGLGLAVLCLSVGMLSGCGKQTDEVSTIQGSGILRATVVDYQNDYMKEADGVYSGTEADLVENVAKALGVKQSFEAADNVEDAVAKVRTGEADLAIAMIPDHIQLEEGMDTSVAYGQERLYVVTQKEDYSDSPAAFSGRTLGAAPSLLGTIQEAANTVDGLNVVSCQNPEEARKALTEDLTIDGYVCCYQEGISMLEAASQQVSVAGRIPIQMQNLQNTDPEQFVIVTKTGSGRLMGGINTIIRQPAGE